MDLLFLKGLAFGFILACTVGPMWVLCLRRTLASGASVGFASGMGIAAADGLYGAIAAFGLTAMSDFLIGQRVVLAAVGGVFLLWLGARTLLAVPAPLESPNGAVRRSHAGAFFSTLGLTLANPPTILAFAAIFAALGLAAHASYAAAGLVVLGVFLGSAAWWVVLAAAAGVLRGRIGPKLMHAINVLLGAAILGFAAWQLTQLL